MKKLMGLVVILGLIAVGCSKTATPTEPANTPKYEIYFGQDAAEHGFVAPTGIQAEKYTQAVYNQHKLALNTKTQKKEFDYDFTCDDIFDLLGSFGVNVPEGVRALQCQGIIHAARRSEALLDWDVVVAVVAGYGLGYQGYVGGVGGLNIAGSITRSMDDITASLSFAVDYFIDSVAVVGSGQWGGRVAVAYGGVAFFDFPPVDHTVYVMAADHFVANDPYFDYPWTGSLTIVVPAQ